MFRAMRVQASTRVRRRGRGAYKDRSTRSPTYCAGEQIGSRTLRALVERLRVGHAEGPASLEERGSVCNATETVLLDRGLGCEAAGRILQALVDAGVTIHGDRDNLGFGPGVTEELLDGVVAATDEDWDDEYLSMDIAAKVVDHCRRSSGIPRLRLSESL